MRKTLHYYCALFLCLFVGGIAAQGQETYKEDFNNSMQTSGKPNDYSTENPDFKPSGWGRIVDPYDGMGFEDESYYEYVHYEWRANGGVDNTGGLYCDQYIVTQLGTENYDACDLLVPPMLNGKATIQVKLDDAKGSIEFYSVIKRGDTYIKGSKLTANTSGLNTSTFTTVTIPATNGYVGIRINKAVVDNYEAEGSTVTKKKGLTIVSLSKISGGYSSDIDCDSDNNYTIGYNVVLRNSGDLALETGDKNYSLTLLKDISANNGDSIDTFPIERNMQPGDTLHMQVVKTFNYKDNDYVGSYAVRENITNTQMTGATFHPVPYEPIPSILNSSFITIKDNDTISFGTSKHPVERAILIRNSGAAPMHVAATVSDDFQLSFNDTIIAKHGEARLTVTMDSIKVGQHAGQVVLKGDSLNMTINLTGNIIAPETYYVDFESSVPKNIITGKWETSSFPNRLNDNNNKQCMAQTTKTVSSKLITPLLTVAKGDSLTFDASKSEADGCTLTVYSSTDRHQWTKLLTIGKSGDVDFGNTNVGYSTLSPAYKFKNFAIKGLAAGNYYIAFEAGGAYLDNINGFKEAAVDEDIYINNVKVSNAEVNSPVSYEATLNNLTSKEYNAGDLSLTLYDGSTKITADSTFALKAYGEATVSFTFTPHKTGIMQLVATVGNDKYVTVSDTTAVNVANESASRTVMVGENKGNTTYDTPVSVTYNYSISQVLYPQAKLEGINKGDLIDHISYKGYNTANEMDYRIKVWLANTDMTDMNATDINTDSMTLVVDDSTTLAKAGTTDAHETLLSLNLNKPFTYGGKGLLVVVEGRTAKEQSFFNHAYFECENSGWAGSNNAILRHNEKGSISKSKVPILYVGVAVQPDTIQGFVTDKKDNSPIAGASVKFASGDVLYEATTDSKGHYSVPIIKSSLTYNVVFSAETYLSDSIADYVPNSAEALSASLTKDPTLGIGQIENKAKDNGRIYTIEGIFAGYNTKELKPGIYIIGRKKVIIR